jgi:hypothetical protein
MRLLCFLRKHVEAPGKVSKVGPLDRCKRPRDAGSEPSDREGSS